MNLIGRRITRYEAALLLIVLLGTFLRLYHIGAQSLGVDDTYSVWISKLSLHDIVQLTAAADVHPPLYYVLLHYWMAFLGTSELAIKLLSIIFGVLSIVVAYALGRRLLDVRAGLFCAFILAISAFNIRYSQEARMYSLLLLFTLLSMYFFIRLTQRGTPLTWAGYVISTTLLLYTHVYGLFVLVAQNLCVVSLLILTREHAVRLRHWVMLQAVVIALFAPWIGVLIRQASALNGYWIPLPTLGTVLNTLTNYAGGTLLLAIFLMLSLLSLVSFSKRNAPTSLTGPLKALGGYFQRMRATNVQASYILIVWLITLTFVPFAISLFLKPIYVDRYTIGASVALYLLAAKGVFNIHRRTVQVAVIVVIVALSAVNVQAYLSNQLNEGWAKEAWVQSRETFGVVNQNGRSGDLIILYPQFLWSVNRYYDKVGGINATFPSTGSGAASDRVWFIAYNYPGPVEQQTLNDLNKTHSVTYAHSFAGYQIYLFEKHV